MNRLNFSDDVLKAIAAGQKPADTHHMSGNVINLRKARKQKQRRDREAEAEANRTRHGQPASLRRASEKQNETERKLHENHRLSTPEKPGI
ncbi:DUF4169 family protein [Alphaproteobacteria bacterium HT1-32]|nr:DUF4169 family protein [Alphaproteobacteria bacterium HT1-32]